MGHYTGQYNRTKGLKIPLSSCETGTHPAANAMIGWPLVRKDATFATRGENSSRHRTMLRRLRRHSLFLLVFVSACASLRSSSGSSELPGQYAYTTIAHGQPVTGTITITRDHAQYSILMTTGGLTKDLLFTDVSITGDRLTAVTAAPNGGRIGLAWVDIRRSRDVTAERRR